VEKVHFKFAQVGLKQIGQEHDPSIILPHEHWSAEANKEVKELITGTQK
jgi:hypothetical protein